MNRPAQTCLVDNVCIRGEKSRYASSATAYSSIGKTRLRTRARSTTTILRASSASITDRRTSASRATTSPSLQSALAEQDQARIGGASERKHARIVEIGGHDPLLLRKRHDRDRVHNGVLTRQH